MSAFTEWRGDPTRGPRPAVILYYEEGDGEEYELQGPTGPGLLPRAALAVEHLQVRERGLPGPVPWPARRVDLTRPYVDEGQELEGVIEIESEVTVDSERVPQLQEPEHVEDLDWLTSNVEELRRLYPGHWVAIVDGEVLASAPDVRDLMETVQAAGIATPLVTFVPEQEVTWRMVYGL